MKTKSTIYMVRNYNSEGKCMMSTWHGDIINAIESAEYWSKSMGLTYKITFLKA